MPTDPALCLDGPAQPGDIVIPCTIVCGGAPDGPRLIEKQCLVPTPSVSARAVPCDTVAICGVAEPPVRVVPEPVPLTVWLAMLLFVWALLVLRATATVRKPR